MPLFRSALVAIEANEKDRLDDGKGTVNSFAQRILRYHEKRNEFECKYVFEGKPGETTRIRVLIFDLHSS